MARLPLLHAVLPLLLLVATQQFAAAWLEPPQITAADENEGESTRGVVEVLIDDRVKIGKTVAQVDQIKRGVEKGLNGDHGGNLPSNEDRLALLKLFEQGKIRCHNAVLKLSSVDPDQYKELQLKALKQLQGILGNSSLGAASIRLDKSLDVISEAVGVDFVEILEIASVEEELLNDLFPQLEELFTDQLFDMLRKEIKKADPKVMKKNVMQGLKLFQDVFDALQTLDPTDPEFEEDALSILLNYMLRLSLL